MGTASTKMAARTSSTGVTNFYALSAAKGDGSIQRMEDLRGKVVYATNVASK